MPKTPTVKQTDVGLRSLLKPAATRREYALGNGLYFSNLSRLGTFAVRYRRPGDHKSVRLVLGPFDASRHEPADDPELADIPLPLTLAAARVLASKVQRQRARGQDAAAEVQARRRRARLSVGERGANTFGVAAREFAVEYQNPKKGRRPRRWSEVARCLGFTLALADDECDGVTVHADGKTLTAILIKGGLAERWADQPLAEITEDDLFVAVRDAQRHGIPGLKMRTRGASAARGRRMADALGSLFKWLKRERRISVNPMADVEWRPAVGARRQRRLSDDEIRWMWLALDDAAAADEVPRAYASLVKFLLVTATRRDEARLMRDDEVIGHDWIVPHTRVKADIDHLVPLSPLARELLAATLRVEGSRLMFTLDGEHHLGNLSRWKRAVAAQMLSRARRERGASAAIESWHLHDFRRNARTFMSRITTSDIAERCLGHVIGGVRRHYDLHSYAQEKRAALEAWAREVARIVHGEPATVVALKPRRQRRS